MKVSKITIAAMLMVATGYAGYVSAHSVGGVIPIKKTRAGGTDQFEVRCSDSVEGGGITDHLTFSVTDKFPRNPALISIQAQYTDPLSGSVIPSPISTDAKDSDGKSSPELFLVGGAGPYIMSITKTRSKMIGRENYGVSFHCVSAGGEHTGTEFSLIQNQ